MNVYFCPRCNFENNHKNTVRRHFRRKNPCKVLNNDIPLEECLKNMNMYKGLKPQKNEVQELLEELKIIKEESMRNY